MTCQSGAGGGLQIRSEGWNPSAVRKGWESWGCSAWRRLQGDLRAAASAWRGLKES